MLRWRPDENLARGDPAVPGGAGGPEAQTAALAADDRRPDGQGRALWPTFHEAGGPGGRVCGTKRTVLIDYLGLPHACRVDSARPADVTAGRALLKERLADFPRVDTIMGDRGYRKLLILRLPGQLLRGLRVRRPAVSVFGPARRAQLLRFSREPGQARRQLRGGSARRRLTGRASYSRIAAPTKRPLTVIS